jgi:hypothetical protein
MEPPNIETGHIFYAAGIHPKRDSTGCAERIKYTTRSELEVYECNVFRGCHYLVRKRQFVAIPNDQHIIICINSCRILYITSILSVPIKTFVYMSILK